MAPEVKLSIKAADLGGFMIGTGELILILGASLLLFGGKKLPEFARNLGIGIREFKKACQGKSEEQEEETQKKNQIDPP